MSAIVEFRGLTLSDAGGRALVDDLSLAVAPGERVGLIGESGSGKSLTALAALGLWPSGVSATGSVRLGGAEVLGASDAALAARRGTVAAPVFQEPLTALDPLMKLGRQVREPVLRRRRRAGEPTSRAALAEEVHALLGRVALPEPARILRAYPHEVSGGQRQRVAIAMALACRPQLLIADEPTTALDVTTQADILALLENLVRDTGMALLFIGHDLPVVARVVDRMIVLRRGEIVEEGATRAVMQTPQHPYARDLVAAAASFDAALGRMS